MPSKSLKGFKSAIVTHNNCPDGAASALFARLLDPQIRVFFSNHIKVNDIVRRAADGILPGGRLYIVDISCDRPVLEELFILLQARGISLRIFEHHISRKWLEDIHPPAGTDLEIVFDIYRCGSLIFFQRYRERCPALRPYEDFSVVVNDRDLWLNRDERGVVLTRLHNVYEDDLFVERMLGNPSLVPTEKEQLLLEYQTRKEEKHLEFLLDTIDIKTDESGFQYGIIYGNGMSSELLDRALQEKSLEYAMLINLNAKRGSIRSRGHFNCAEFALIKGGGGHKCAAGFPIEFDFPIV